MLLLLSAVMVLVEVARTLEVVGALADVLHELGGAHIDLTLVVVRGQLLKRVGAILIHLPVLLLATRVLVIVVLDGLKQVTVSARRSSLVRCWLHHLVVWWLIVLVVSRCHHAAFTTAMREKSET